jgi:hypothetical protein
VNVFGRRTLRAYDVLSVLLFAILANFIFGLNIDFTAPIDLIVVARLVCLGSGCVLFYSISSRLTEYWAYAMAEFSAEHSVAKRAEMSAEARFDGYVAKVRRGLIARLLSSSALIAMFFFLDPLLRVLSWS